MPLAVARCLSPLPGFSCFRLASSLPDFSQVRDAAAARRRRALRAAQPAMMSRQEFSVRCGKAVSRGGGVRVRGKGEGGLFVVAPPVTRCHPRSDNTCRYSTIGYRC